MSRAKKPIKYYSAARRKIYAAGDEIDALTLFNLFGWTCFLCEGPIDPRHRCPSWWAATIEHIVPLSAGGTHTWDNVAPAHLRCNENKGSNPRQAATLAGTMYSALGKDTCDESNEVGVCRGLANSLSRQARSRFIFESNEGLEA